MTELQNLRGKKRLIVGIANADSIAYGCVKAMSSARAELAVTYLNEKAEPHVRPLAVRLKSDIILPCYVEDPRQRNAVFREIEKHWRTLDFLVHSIAFAPISGDIEPVSIRNITPPPIVRHAPTLI